MKDRRTARLLPLELLVEAEDGPLAGLVHIADAAAAGGEVAGGGEVERG